MQLYLRWDGRSKTYVFYIYRSMNDRMFDESPSRPCKFCLKKHSPGEIVPSKIFFMNDRLIPMRGFFSALSSFERAILPIPVIEKAVILDRDHTDITELSRSKLLKGIITALNEAKKLVTQDFNRIILAFQSKIISHGTLSHPQIRLFALKIPELINTLNIPSGIKREDILLRSRFHALISQFIREKKVDLLITSDKLSFLSLQSYTDEKTQDFVDLIIKSMTLISNDPFIGILNIINEKFYVRLINYSNKIMSEIPVIFFNIAGLRAASVDLDESDLVLKENVSDLKNVGGHVE